MFYEEFEFKEIVTIPTTHQIDWSEENEGKDLRFSDGDVSQFYKSKEGTTFVAIRKKLQPTIYVWKLPEHSHESELYLGSTFKAEAIPGFSEGPNEMNRVSMKKFQALRNFAWIDEQRILVFEIDSDNVEQVLWKSKNYLTGSEGSVGLSSPVIRFIQRNGHCVFAQDVNNILHVVDIATMQETIQLELPKIKRLQFKDNHAFALTAEEIISINLETFELGRREPLGKTGNIACFDHTGHYFVVATRFEGINIYFCIEPFRAPLLYYQSKPIQEFEPRMSLVSAAKTAAEPDTSLMKIDSAPSESAAECNWVNLPFELQLVIASMLDLETRYKASTVSKGFYRVMHDGQVNYHSGLLLSESDLVNNSSLLLRLFNALRTGEAKVIAIESVRVKCKHYFFSLRTVMGEAVEQEISPLELSAHIKC